MAPAAKPGVLAEIFKVYLEPLVRSVGGQVVEGWGADLLPSITMAQWLAGVCWLIAERLVRLPGNPAWTRRPSTISRLAGLINNLVIGFAVVSLKGISRKTLDRIASELGHVTGDAGEGLLEGLRIRASDQLRNWGQERDDAVRAAAMKEALDAAQDFVDETWGKAHEELRELGIVKGGGATPTSGAKGTAGAASAASTTKASTTTSTATPPKTIGWLERGLEMPFSDYLDKLQGGTPEEQARAITLETALSRMSSLPLERARVIDEADVRGLLPPDRFARCLLTKDTSITQRDPDDPGILVTKWELAMAHLAKWCAQAITDDNTKSATSSAAPVAAETTTVTKALVGGAAVSASTPAGDHGHDDHKAEASDKGTPVEEASIFAQKTVKLFGKEVSNFLYCGKDGDNPFTLIDNAERATERHQAALIAEQIARGQLANPEAPTLVVTSKKGGWSAFWENIRLAINGEG